MQDLSWSIQPISVEVGPLCEPGRAEVVMKECVYVVSVDVATHDKLIPRQPAMTIETKLEIACDDKPN